MSRRHNERANEISLFNASEANEQNEKYWDNRYQMRIRMRDALQRIQITA